MEAEAPIPARHTVRGSPAMNEARASGSAQGKANAEAEAEAAGVDLAWARHQQNMRDKKVRGTRQLISLLLPEQKIKLCEQSAKKSRGVGGREWLTRYIVLDA